MNLYELYLKKLAASYLKSGLVGSAAGAGVVGAIGYLANGRRGAKEGARIGAMGGGAGSIAGAYLANRKHKKKPHEKLAAVDQSYQATRLSQRRRRAAHLKSDIAFTKQPVMKHDFEQKQIASSALRVRHPKMKKPGAAKFNPKKSIRKR